MQLTNMISTKNLTSLPERRELQNIAKAISVAEAIICQDWQYRYYSYQSKWSDDEEFCEMRDGEGGQMLILFRKDGCVINGMDHEFHPKDKAKLTKGLPSIYSEFMFGEPVHSTGTTFCVWTNSREKWEHGKIETFDDGSENMLYIFDGNPETYINWASDYYEDNFIPKEDTNEIISALYSGKTLTKQMVLSLVDELEDWEKLISELEEINYPFEFR
jgi:hypothetical protein